MNFKMQLKSGILSRLCRHPIFLANLLRWTGYFQAERDTYLRLIKKSQTVFDIGGNLGGFTVLFSNIVGPNGSVHAFEPVPPTFAQLSKRINTSTLYNNVTLNNLAIGDADTTINITVPAGDIGQASLKEHNCASWLNGDKQTYECQLLRLDAYIEQRNLERLDFLKIDVEGAELLVLKGGTNALKRFQPVIHLEYYCQWAKTFEYDSTDLLRQLNECGYQYFYDEQLRTMNSPHKQIQANPESQNIICSCKPLF